MDKVSRFIRRNIYTVVEVISLTILAALVLTLFWVIMIILWV